MTYGLAKEAGMNIGYAWCDDVLPESQVYLMPSIKGCYVMPRNNYLELIRRVEEGATLYIRLYVGVAPAIMVYNFGAAILRSLGDSQRPLYYIIFCGLLNVVLNVILCFVLEQKVAAVAIATAASHILGAILVLIRLTRLDGIGKIEFRKLEWDTTTFGKILRYGFPVALANSLFPIANLQIQTAINSFGVSAMAGSAAATTIEKVPSAFAGGFGASTTAFIGQNIGAQKPDRVKKSFFSCFTIGTLLTGIVGVLLYLSSDFWLSIIQPNDLVAVEYAKIKMFYVLLFYGFGGVTNILAGGLSAFGYTVLNSITSVVSVLGLRTMWMVLIYPRYETFHVLMACYLASYIVRALLYAIFFTLVYKRYQKGKYSRI
jgi:Na+-driven multidrug efflux pump